jgi:hypothetical protein
MPFPISPVQHLLDQGVVYGFKRDKGFRPVVIINVERLIASKV